MKKSVATTMNRVHKLISLPANLLLTAAVSPAIFTVLTIKKKRSKTTQKRLFKREEQDFEEVQQAPPTDYSANYVVKLCSDSAVCFYDHSSYLP
jgi:hypothetical protein